MTKLGHVLISAGNVSGRALLNKVSAVQKMYKEHFLPKRQR